MTASPRCPRDHRRSWPDGVPMDRILTGGGGWSCPGILPDGTDCGYEIGVVRAAPVDEAAELRDLIAEILDSYAATDSRGLGTQIRIAKWRERARLEPEPS